MTDADIERLTRRIKANGLEFPVVDTGSGEPVLLLHGFPDSRHLWRHQIPALQEAGFRVLAPDLRGFGDAPKPEAVSAYMFPELWNDVWGILDALAIERCAVVGHDWGAALGWQMTARFPQRVSRFVTLSVGHPHSPGGSSIRQRELFWYILYFQFEGLAEEWLTMDNWKGLREWTRGLGEVERMIANLSRPGALTAGLNWYRANAKPRNPREGRLPMPDIQCPVLGIWSDGDLYLSEAYMTGTGAVLGSRFRYAKISGASHWMMLDQPEELNRLLLAFLRER